MGWREKLEENGDAPLIGARMRTRHRARRFAFISRMSVRPGKTISDREMRRRGVPSRAPRIFPGPAREILFCAWKAILPNHK